MYVYGWFIVFISFVMQGLFSRFFAHLWLKKRKRPKLKSYPKVSVIIPAYKSEKTIKYSILSAKRLDYPKKEIIVVNDSQDGTPEICKKLGVRCIQNKKRLGKPVSLNKAVKKTTGDVLFFLDSDTVVEKDALQKIIPWFSKPDVAVVAPKYVCLNKGFIPHLASIENMFNNALFKMHMYFGSMLSFRGCGVAIRRDVFLKLGGWSKTLIEDTDFAMKVLRSGYVVHYEPDAVVRTKEPEDVKELKSQKIRWGMGTWFITRNHGSTCLNKQFLLHFGPYFTIAIVILFLTGYSIWQFFFGVSALKTAATFFSNLLLFCFLGGLLNLIILVSLERKDLKDILMLIPYVFFYIPLTLGCYFFGIAKGIKAKRKGHEELDLGMWD